MRRPDARNVGGWVLFAVAVAVLVAVGVPAGLYAAGRWPIATTVAGTSWATAVLTATVHGRSLRAELEAARRLHAAWDGSAVRDDLAEVGPVTGDDLDPERWVSSCHRPPVEHLGQACGWSDGGHHVCGAPAEGWARWPDGEPMWVCGRHMAWMREQADLT